MQGLGKSDTNCCALSQEALHRKLPVVCLGNTLADSESQSRSTLFPRARYIHAVETFTNMRQMLWRNACACVCHVYPDRCAISFCGKGDPSFSGGVARSIVQEVSKKAD